MAQEETRKMKDFSSLTLTCILVLLEREHNCRATRTRNNFQHARVLFTRWIRFCAAAFVRPTFWRKIFLCCESKKGFRNIFPHYYSGASSGEDKKPETEFIARLAGVGVNAPEVHSTRLIRVWNRVTVPTKPTSLILISPFFSFQLSEDIGYVLYSALGSFYIPSCIMVFVYIRIYYAAKARARRGIRKQPRKPPNEQVSKQTSATPDDDGDDRTSADASLTRTRTYYILHTFFALSSSSTFIRNDDDAWQIGGNFSSRAI